MTMAKRKTETRSLMTALTATEFVTMSEELAKELTELGILEGERSVINAKMKPKKERVDTLVPILDKKEMKKDIECYWVYNWENGTRVLYRSDTGEEVDTDVIPERERQQHLEFNEE